MTRRNALAGAKLNLCHAVLAVAIASSLTPSIVSAQSLEARSSFSIPAGDLASAVDAFSRQSGLQILYKPELLAGKRAKPVAGTLSSKDALNRLVEGTGVKWERVNPTTLILKPGTSTKKSRDPSGVPDAEAPANEEVKALPEVLVVGSRSLNADIARSRDDIQPYVVFERDQIEQSLATSVEEFINTRLPMNATRGTASRNYPGTTEGNRTSFDLRGLGANQTLILINGRRAPGIQAGRGTDLAQPDLNGIPLAAIDRIEILPTTASGIYGGGATGGVINIILRKDYEGSEIQLSYDNTFDTDSARRRVDASSGFSLEAGRTQVMVSASFADANDLLGRDRDFASRARSAAVENDPLGMERNIPASNRTNYRSVDGNLLTLVNGTSLGSFFGTVPVGYVGGDNGAGLVAGAGSYDLSIPEGVSAGGQSLVATPTTNAFNLTVRRNFSSRVDAYLDAGTTQNKSRIRYAAGGAPEYLLFPGDAGNPFNNIISFSIPAGDYVAETESDAQTRRINGGLIVSLPSEWSAGFDVTWNQSSTKYASTYGTYDTYSIERAFASGALNAFRDVALFPLDLSPYLAPLRTKYGPSEVSTLEYAARVAGPMFTLPAGKVHLSALASYRENDAESLTEPTGTQFRYLPARHQDVSSLYVESIVPLVAPTQEVPMINSLEMQASIRWDSYKTVSVATGQQFILATRDAPIPSIAFQRTDFESTDYTLGLRYRPIESLALRASYATGFLPPSLAQIASLVIEQGYGLVRDPKRGNIRTYFPARNVVGGNPDVQPEESQSFSAGLVYTPSVMEGLRLSIDYTRIKKQGEIVVPSQQEIVDLEDIIPGRVVRGPVRPTDPVGYAGPITSIDTSVLNIASSKLEALDFQIDYDHYFEKGGDIKVYAIATRQTTLERQVLPTSPVVSRVGFSDGPLEWRGNIGAVWRVGNLTLAANTQIYDRYKVYASTFSEASRESAAVRQGSHYVSAQSYTDVSARYSFTEGWLSGTQISLGVRNVFDQSPPVIAGFEGYGGYSTFGDPRMRSYTVTIKKSF